MIFIYIYFKLTHSNFIHINIFKFWILKCYFCFSLESLMVSLSTTTNITCKFTAFVGVDKHSKEIVAKGIYLFDIQIQEFEGTKFLELQIRKLKTGISSKKN